MVFGNLDSFGHSKIQDQEFLNSEIKQMCPAHAKVGDVPLEG